MPGNSYRSVDTQLRILARLWLFLHVYFPTYSMEVICTAGSLCQPKWQKYLEASCTSSYWNSILDLPLLFVFSRPAFSLTIQSRDCTACWGEHLHSKQEWVRGQGWAPRPSPEKPAADDKPMLHCGLLSEESKTEKRCKFKKKKKKYL